MNNYDVQLLAKRLDDLSVSHWRLKVLVLVLPLFALLLGAAAQEAIDWKGKSVTTEKLILVDAKGKERGALYTNEGGDPILEFYNADHSLLLNAGRSNDNGVGFMQFFDKEGKFKGGVGGNALK